MIKTLTKAQKLEREKFRIPRSVQDAIPIRKDAADGDGVLYTARNTELFAFHLLRFCQGFNQAVSSLSWVFFFIGKPLFRFMPARMAGCMAS